MPRANAFTLIELLIVVAIIAILAAIAVPNFLEAQTRAKVSRARSDMRVINTGMAQYLVDNILLPYNGTDINGLGRYSARDNSFNFFGIPWAITTPISYISNAKLLDPFAVAGTRNAQGSQFYPGQQNYFYEGGNQGNSYIPERYVSHYSLQTGPPAILARDPAYSPANPNPADRGYAIWSMGPDGVNGFMTSNNGEGWGLVYDPTNGTVSNGDIGNFYAGGTAVSPGGGS